MSVLMLLHKLAVKCDTGEKQEITAVLDAECSTQRSRSDTVSAAVRDKQQGPAQENHCRNDFFREDPGRALWIQGETSGSRE